MKVAVPLPKHSLMLGQEASSQTVCSFCSRRISLTSLNLLLADASLTRIQSGFLSASARGTILIGMRAVLAAPRCFSGAVISMLLVDVALNRSEQSPFYSLEPDRAVASQPCRDSRKD